jgi:putative transcriptional regulator
MGAKRLDLTTNKRILMKRPVFDELLESVKQGAAIMKGTMNPSRTMEFPEAEVRKIRERYRLSQDRFASLMGISVPTLRNWEQGRRKPEGPARVLLRVAAEHPEAILDITRRQKVRKMA